MRLTQVLLLLATVVIGGCGGNGPLDPNRPRRRVATEFGGQLAPVDDQGRPLGKQSTPPPPPPAPSGEQPHNGTLPPPPPPPPANVVREAAKPGVTGKGEGYRPGPIATPIATYFRLREKLVFDIQIASAMNTYKGINEHFPKTHEEFMEKIIKQNGIVLPKLRSPDHRYVYDPEKAAKMSVYDKTDPPLMVEHPR